MRGGGGGGKIKEINLNMKKALKKFLKKTKHMFNTYIKYSSLAFQMMGMIGISVWIGLKLDKFFDFRFPVCLSILSLGTVIAITYLLIKKVSKES